MEIVDRKRSLKEKMQGASMQNILGGFGAMAGADYSGFGGGGGGTRVAGSDNPPDKVQSKSFTNFTTE
jgi:hypothetical protein